MKKSLGAKTILYPTPVIIVGTYDDEGKPNAMTVAWGGICCSVPPCVAVSLRKATYSHGNIVKRQAFTVSVPSERHVKEADYFGIASGRNEDKFAVTRLTPVRSDLVDAPYVEEFPLVLECRLAHTFELGLHTQFVGEILDVKADEECWAQAGCSTSKNFCPSASPPKSTPIMASADNWARRSRSARTCHEHHMQTQSRPPTLKDVEDVDMGTTHVMVMVRNPANPAKTWEGLFLVDTDAVDSLIPGKFPREIGLSPKATRTYQLADGSEVKLDITTGELEFMGEIVGSTLIFGDDDAEPILGVTALESVGIEVDPRSQQLKRLPAARLKGLG